MSRRIGQAVATTRSVVAGFLAVDRNRVHSSMSGDCANPLCRRRRGFSELAYGYTDDRPRGLTMLEYSRPMAIRVGGCSGHSRRSLTGGRTTAVSKIGIRSCASPRQGSARSCRTLRRPPNARSASKSLKPMAMCAGALSGSPS